MLLCCVATLPAAAATLTWNNPAGGNWNAAANWSPSQIPTAADTVQITTPGTYIITIDSAVAASQIQAGAASGTQTLRMTGGSLTLSASASFATNAPFEWVAGTLAGTGTFSFAGPVTLSSIADRGLSSVTVVTLGQSRWEGTGRIVGSNGGRWQQSGNLVVTDAAAFVWSGFGSGPAFSWGEGSVLATGTSEWKFVRHTTGNTNALTFSQQPASTNVNFGAPVTFTSLATGAGEIRYQWRRNGNAIGGATNASYTLASATTGGQYSVRVEDDYDSITSTNAVLTITGSPTLPAFTLNPASQTAPAGAVVTFNATATGNPPPTYQWTFNGSPIPGATGSTLVINGVTATNQGQYRVTASNSVGAANSLVATLSVTAGVTPVAVADPGTGGRLNSINFLNTQFGFVTGDAGAFRYTANGGATWSASVPGVPNRITGAAFYGGAYWIAGSGGLLCVSYDNGATWVPFNTGVTEDFYGIAFGRDGSGFAVGARGTICIYRNGVWLPATGIPGNVDFYGIYTFGSAAWAVGSGGTICVYRNGVWTAANTGGFGGTFYGVGFWDANYGIAVGSGGTICVTRNGGASWAPLNSGTTGDFYSVAFASANVVFAGGRGGLLCVSLNRGTSWIPLASGTTADITSVFWRDGQGYYVDSEGRCRAFRYAGFVPNQPPTVRILNPTNTFTLATNVVANPGGGLTTNVVTVRHDHTNIACVPIPFRAVASDPDDSVFAVELYVNGFPIDNDPANPVEHFWDNCTPGRYWLAALAVDTRGAVAYSENIAITVLPPLHRLVPSIRPDGLVRLCYAGDTNKAYGVEISTDLVNWSYLGPFFPTNSILQYLDGPTTTAPHRLYRAVEIPKGP